MESTSERLNPPMGLQSVTVYTVKAPTWIVPVSMSIVGGYLHSSLNQSTDSKIGCDNEGNVVLNRKLVNDDWLIIPELRGISEIWVTFGIESEES